MAHAAAQFVEGVSQRTSPADTAEAEQAHVAAQAAKYDAEQDATHEQYQILTDQVPEPEE